MSEPRAPGTGDEHDAWLHQALRHAPDAASAPPNTLREAILAEARSAVQTRRRPLATPSLVARFGAFWSWLSQPPVAAGFASVMAATLVGLMWWDRPMDEGLPPPATSSMAPMAPVPTTPATTAAPALANAEPPSRASPAAAPPAAAPTPPPAAEATRRALVAPAKTTPAAADAVEQRKDRSTASSMQAAPPASPFPNNAPGESAAAARERAAGPALAKKAEGEAATAAAEAQRAVATPQPFAAAPTTAAPTTRDSLTNARPLAAAGAASTMRPMAALLASIAAGDGPWSRPTSNGDAALDALTQAWLESVDAATAGRWQPRSADRTTSRQGALAADTGTLALSRDGGAGATVRVEDGGVLFEPPDGPAWFAPLPADAVARLRATLPR